MAILQELIQYKWPLLVGAVTLWVLRKFLAYNRLRQFKGPWATAFSDLTHSVKWYRGESSDWYRDVSEKYGPIARIGPNALITSSPEVWIHVNTKPAYQRTGWYFNACRLEHQRDHVFSQTDNKLHDDRRKQIAPGYSGRENLELESSIDTSVLTLLTLIRTKYLSTPTDTTGTTPTIIPMDLSKKIQYLTLDIISAIGFGRAFGLLAADTDLSNYIRSSEEGLRISNTFAALGLAWLVQAPVIGKLLAPKPTDKNGFGAMMGACHGAIQERVELDRITEGGEKRRDMLASFMRHGLGGHDLNSEVFETLVAGSDTTAGALRGTMLYLMANPRVYGELRREIDAAVREGKVPESGEGVISQAVARGLPYLQAVIREGLRVWPPVRNLLPKDVPAGGDTVVVDGKPVFLPGGVEIGVSTSAMHRDKRLYGEDADMFRPERWFEPDEKKLAAMTRVNDLTFGFGRWQCLGKPVAQMELNKVFFELLRNFDWAIANPAKPWESMNTLGIFVINDFWVQATARSD